MEYASGPVPVCHLTCFKMLFSLEISSPFIFQWRKPSSMDHKVSWAHFVPESCGVVQTVTWLMMLGCSLQRNLTHTWPWRCRMSKAQRSPCAAASRVGSRTLCCECVLSSLTSPHSLYLWPEGELCFESYPFVKGWWEKVNTEASGYTAGAGGCRNPLGTS